MAGRLSYTGLLLALITAHSVCPLPAQETARELAAPLKATAGSLREIEHRVVQISPTDAQSAVEVSIAINPTDTSNIIAGAIMRGYPKSQEPNYTFQTTDGGVHWTTVPSINPDRRTQGDDVVVFSGDGVAVHGYICFVGLWEQRPQRTSNGIFTSRTADKGVTWEAPVAVIDHINSKTPMEDKPWFVFDRNPDSPYFNSLYCSWTRFDVYGSDDEQDTTQILFARSVDSGKSFQPVIRISDKPGTCIDGDNALEGATPCVGIDGTVHVVWAGPRGIEMDSSRDGGQTFGEDRVISEFVGGWDHDVQGIGRANGMPVTGVDLSAGPYRGTIYVNWIDERNGDKDVFVMRSRDGGESWSVPVRVNNDGLGNGRDQFFTWMSVDPADGSVNVAFYDRRDSADTKTRLTLARSIDGGQSFDNFAISGMPAFECYPNSFFGDYLGIDAQQGRVAVAFMHFVEAKRLAISTALFDFQLGANAARE